MEEKDLVKKSIFKQIKQRTIYSFKETLPSDYKCKDCDSLHYATHAEIEKNERYVSEEIIYTCNLEMPMLNPFELFYIEELDMTVQIMSRVRSSKDNVCYCLCPETIEDEISQKSEEDAKQLQKDFYSNHTEGLIMDKLKAQYILINQLKQFKRQVMSNFWYKFMKKSISS